MLRVWVLFAWFPIWQASPWRQPGFYGEVLGLEVVMDLGWIVTLGDPDRPGARISC